MVYGSHRRAVKRAVKRVLRGAAEPSPTGAELYEHTIVSRAERKQRTRNHLLESALRLMEEGRSFTSLGLREMTRAAGVVPTSFYRHFEDMDQLALALVEETGITLRRLLREARQEGVPPLNIIRHSVQIYKTVRRGPPPAHHVHGGRALGRLAAHPTRHPLRGAALRDRDGAGPARAESAARRSR